MKSTKNSRNQYVIPKYKTNDYKNTALVRFTKDAQLHKQASGGIIRLDEKNTSAVVGNYSKISESMTFDYSIESHGGKERMSRAHPEMINNFDPSNNKALRKSSNYVSKKIGISTTNIKPPVLTPKSQSPSNENSKSRKVSKGAK